MPIDLNEVGAHPTRTADGGWRVRFGIYLPEITFPKGYRLKVRVIHERDQFIRGIEPRDFWLTWHDTELSLWEATVAIAPLGAGSFGQEGTYLYRFQLIRDDRDVTFWFADPFARANGLGTLSAFTVDSAATPFPWTDANFKVPEVDELVVYELHVREFNHSFDGVVEQLDYLQSLGVNCIELMPVSNVKEEVEWGYTPLGYFAPDERLGGVAGLKRLVNACHARGIAVIHDAVYAHAHPEFAYNLVYSDSGEPNPMMGYFAGEFFSQPGADYTKSFTRDYFRQVNRYWIDEYHIDGFRYDYVPGMYDGPVGQGYAYMVYHTYQDSRGVARFQGPEGRNLIIQCAEHLPDPQGVLRQTYTNTAWQNGLLDVARGLARGGGLSERFAHQLDPEFIGYPSSFNGPSASERFPVAPLQYFESHDHGRFITLFGRDGNTDLLGEPFGDRGRFYKTQPYVIALYTAKGVPMLWAGQEFAENWSVPHWGIGRNLFQRSLHWEFFYDPEGKALIRLYRTLGALRRRHRALHSRGFFFYVNDPNHLRQGAVVYRREAEAAAGQPAERMVVVLNFAEGEAEVWVPFPYAGRWVEQIDRDVAPRPPVDVAAAGEWEPVRVPGNYGAVYLLDGAA